MNCTIEYKDDAELSQKLRTILAQIDKPQRVTVSDLAKLVGRRIAVVSRSLRRPTCPPFRARRTATSRIIDLEPNADLLTFLRANTRRGC